MKSHRWTPLEVREVLEKLMEVVRAIPHVPIESVYVHSRQHLFSRSLDVSVKIRDVPVPVPILSPLEVADTTASSSSGWRTLP